MDVDRLLNLEKRTGIKDADIDDFVRRAEEVEKALKGMLDGTVDPASIHIEGLETEEQKRKKEEELAEKRRKYLEKEAALQRERKREERERWWSGAEVYFPKESDKQEVKSANSNGKLSEEDKKQLKISRYTMDYSKWDSWSPSDEVSRQEELEREEREEKLKNEEFEKNNPEFCKQFVEDMANRKKSTQKKQEQADSLRLKGNKFFKAKDFTRALETYMEALKSAPFDPKLLLNIAQAQIKLKDLDEGLEFLRRTLYLDPNNVKALSRHAFVLAEKGETAEALVSLNHALTIEPKNEELLTQHREISIIEHEKQAEAKALKLKEQLEQHSNIAEVNESVPPTFHDESTSPFNQEQTLLLIDSLHALELQQQQGSESDISPNFVRSFSTILKQFAAFLAISSLDTAQESNQEVTIIRTYFRTSNTLSFVLHVLKRLWASNVKRFLTTADTSSDNTEEQVEIWQVFVSLWTLTTHMVRKERSGKQMLLDQKFMSLVVKDVLSCVHHELDLLMHGTTQQKKPFSLLKTFLSTLQVASHFLVICTEDDTNNKIKTFLWHEKSLFANIAHVLGTMIQSLSKESDEAEEETLKHALVHDLLRYMQACTQEEAGRLAISEICQTDPALGVLCLCSIGSALQWLVQLQTQTAQKKRNQKDFSFEWWDTMLSLLLGVSQIEELRSHFTVPLPLNEQSTVQVLIAAIQAPPPAIQVSNLLAVLLNITIDGSSASSTSSSVKQALVDGGFTSTVLQSLALPSVQSNQSLYDEDDEEHVLTRCRFAGLLSRIVSIPSVTQVFVETQQKEYRALCQRFTFLVQRTTTTKSTQKPTNERIEKWLKEEAQHLLRVLAALTPTATSVRQAWCQVAHEEKVVAALLQLFPEPRRDCGEFTPTSVTQMPLNMQEIPSAVVLGNAARCLLHFSDDVITAQEIFMQEKLLGIEKLICGMATITDIRVRRNISIVLAKGIKTMGNQPNGSRVRERITYYRGLQMMIQLQDQL